MLFVNTLGYLTSFTLNAAANEATTEASVINSAEESVSYLKNMLLILQEFAITYGGRLIVGIILLIIGFKIVNGVTKKIEKTSALKKVDGTAKSFIRSALSIVFKVIIAMTALSIMGVPMSSMIAIIGSCGLAVGLALQGSLANIAGGFIILVLKPFRVGDFVVCGDVSGTVSDIGIFSTKITTVDNREVIVPNSTISNATLINVTKMPERRVDLTFNAAYSADINTVERVLVETCLANEKVLKDPEPFAKLSGHKEFTLEYTVRAWCKTEDYWTVYFDLIKEVKYAFDKNGITIPFPQFDVHQK